MNTFSSIFTEERKIAKGRYIQHQSLVSFKYNYCHKFHLICLKDIQNKKKTKTKSKQINKIIGKIYNQIKKNY